VNSTDRLSVDEALLKYNFILFYFYAASFLFSIVVMLKKVYVILFCRVRSLHESDRRTDGQKLHIMRPTRTAAQLTR